MCLRRGRGGRRSVQSVSGASEETTGRTRAWRFRRVANQYLNPVMQVVAKRLPGFAILTHRGRKTGRTYRTPVNVFRRGDTYLFFLTYGSDAQWVRNVLSSGSCSIETRGRVVELVQPELVTDPELRPAPALSASSNAGSPVSRSTCGCALLPPTLPPSDEDGWRCEWPREESNLRAQIRSLPLYPLSYGAVPRA